MTGQQAALTKLLGCGSLDLKLLDDIGYDLGSILQELIDDGCLSLNNIFMFVFDMGICELREAVEARLEHLYTEEEMDDCFAEQEQQDIQTEIDELKLLQPYPNKDISYFTNCQDTHIYFDNNEDIYRKYFTDEISDIEDNMGFCFATP